MILVIDRRTSRLEEVQNAYILLKCLCSHALDLESITILLVQRMMATTMLIKHGQSALIFVHICFKFINVQAVECGRKGASLFNTNVGHYFMMSVIHDLYFALNCSIQ